MSESGKRKVLLLGNGPLHSHLEAQLLQAGFLPSPAPKAPLPHPAEDGARAKLDVFLGTWARENPNDELWIHPGLGSWAEKADLASLTQKYGIQCLMPTPKTLSLFSNKLSFLNEAERANIPHLLLTPQPFSSRRELEKILKPQKITPPVLVRSALGGGRHGIFTLRDQSSLTRSFELWIEQLRLHVGETVLYLERSLDTARRLTVPFARFFDGKTVIFPLVDSSLHSEHQKLIEICPALGIDAEVKKKLHHWTQLLADRVNYVGVGSFEFLVEADDTWLVDGSARLNTAFVLWESAANVKAVDWQLATLQFKSPPDEMLRTTASPSPSTWISARILAEDVLRQLPRPGIVSELEPIDGFYSLLSPQNLPQEVSWKGAGQLGVLMASGASLQEAIQHLLQKLDRLWIAGTLQTNVRSLQEILTHPWVQEGWFHDRFLDEEFIPQLRPTVEMLTLIADLGVLLDSKRPAATPSPPARWAVGDLWASPSHEPLTWSTPPRFHHVPDHSDLWVLQGDLKFPQPLRVSAWPITGGAEPQWQIRVGHWTRLVRKVLTPPHLKPSPKALALVSGKIHAMLSREGGMVHAHEPFVIIESLGRLVAHAAPYDFTLNRWKISPEMIVHQGQDLAEIVKKVE